MGGEDNHTERLNFSIRQDTTSSGISVSLKRFTVLVAASFGPATGGSDERRRLPG